MRLELVRNNNWQKYFVNSGFIRAPLRSRLAMVVANKRHVLKGDPSGIYDQVSHPLPHLTIFCELLLNYNSLTISNLLSSIGRDLRNRTKILEQNTYE